MSDAWPISHYLKNTTKILAVTIVVILGSIFMSSNVLASADVHAGTFPTHDGLTCADCHKVSLVDEHVGKTGKSYATITCDTCHKSTIPNVLNAIANHQTNCDACHTSSTAIPYAMHSWSHYPAHFSAFVSSPQVDCKSCHSNNLETLHTPPLGCNQCHFASGYTGSTYMAVYNARWVTRTTKCDACHNAAALGAKEIHNDLESQHTSIFIDNSFVDCSKCHKNSLTQEHAGRTYNGQAITCNTCHTSTDPKVISAIAKGINGNTKCSTCHDNIHTNIDGSHESTFGSDALTLSCSECHNAKLNIEHASRTDANGTAYNCATCHNSTDTNVQNSISAKNKDCSACHKEAGHEEVHVDTLDASCTEKCHKTTLTQEHLNNPITQTKTLTCSSCHKSANQDVTTAISGKDLNCSGCHDKLHGISLQKVKPDDIPLYDLVSWSSPAKADVWAGETWMPEEFVQDGLVLISNRSNNLNGDEVWTFYKAQLTATGWILASNAPTAGSNYCNASFTKRDPATGKDRKLLLYFYGGDKHVATPVSSAGYRIEMIYN